MDLVIACYSRDLVFHIGGTASHSRGRRRGVCRRFSRASARRMLFHLRNCAVPFRVLITLTYPAVYPRSWGVCRVHLKRFFNRLFRRYPGIRCFWFLEFQLRGAPHFHIFVDRPVDVGWVSAVWAAVCSSDVPASERERHLRAGTRCEFLRGGLGAAISYAAKYARKQKQKEPPADFVGSGRWWGYRGYRLVVKAVFTARLLHRRLVWVYDRLTGPGAWFLGLGDRVAAALSGFALFGTMRAAEWEVLRSGGWLSRSRWVIYGGSGEFFRFVREVVAALRADGVSGLLWIRRRVSISSVS